MRLPTRKLEALEGLISPATGRRLAELAANVPADLAIVELGSYKGKSTCYLAAGAKAGNGALVYAIDAWNLDGNVAGRFGFDQASTRHAFEMQVASLGLVGFIEPIRGFATDVAADWVTRSDRQVGLLFIDADHAYESVRDDFQAWEPHLASGAVVVFDDYETPKNPGVKRFVDELDGWDVTIEAPLAICRRR